MFYHIFGEGEFRPKALLGSSTKTKPLRESHTEMGVDIVGLFGQRTFQAIAKENDFFPNLKLFTLICHGHKSLIVEKIKLFLVVLVIMINLESVNKSKRQLCVRFHLDWLSSF